MTPYLARLKNFEKGGEGHPKKPKESPQSNCLGFLGALPPPFPKNEGQGKNTEAGKIAPETDAGQVHRLWLITRPNGERFSVSRNPPCTQADVAADYPACVIEPEADPAPGAPLHPDDLAIAYALLRHWQEDDTATGLEWIDGMARDPDRLEQMRQMALAAGVARYETPPEPIAVLDPDPSPQAICARCRHWQADRINPPGGLGRCLIDAPRSRKAGSCWPHDHAAAAIHCTQFEDSTHE